MLKLFDILGTKRKEYFNSSAISSVFRWSRKSFGVSVSNVEGYCFMAELQNYRDHLYFIREKIE